MSREHRSLWEQDAHLQVLMRSRFHYEIGELLDELWQVRGDRDQLPTWQPLLNAVIEMVRQLPVSHQQRHVPSLDALQPNASSPPTNTNIWGQQ